MNVRFHLCPPAERTDLISLRLRMLHCKPRIRISSPNKQHRGRKLHEKSKRHLKTTTYNSGINRNPRARRRPLINLHLSFIPRPSKSHPFTHCPGYQHRLKTNTIWIRQRLRRKYHHFAPPARPLTEISCWETQRLHHSKMSHVRDFMTGKLLLASSFSQSKERYYHQRCWWSWWHQCRSFWPYATSEA